MHLEIDSKYGNVITPALHDGWLVGICAPGQDIIEITVEQLNHQRFNFVLEGVVEFQADEFRCGNIILDVTINRGKNARFDSLGQLKSPHGVYSADTLGKLFQRIIDEDLSVILINPSYGCQLIGVARQIRLR